MKKGIQEVEFEPVWNKHICLLVFIQQFGGLYSNLPTGKQWVIWNNTQLVYNVDHEIIEVLNYKGKKCHEITNKENYHLTECHNAESYKVGRVLKYIFHC